MRSEPEFVGLVDQTTSISIVIGDRAPALGKQHGK
jgi:hypothetical protein